MPSRITLARERAQLTQKELANKMQIKPSTLSGYETGAHDPKSDGLIKIATICNVTADYLLGLTDSPCGHFKAESIDLPRSDADLISAYHVAPEHIQTSIDCLLDPYKQIRSKEEAM